MRTTSKEVREKIVIACKSIKVVKRNYPNDKIRLCDYFKGVHIGYECLEGIDWTKSVDECVDRLLENKRRISARYNSTRNDKRARERMLEIDKELGTSAQEEEIRVNASDVEPAVSDGVPSRLRVYKGEDGQLWISLQDFADMFDAFARRTIVDNSVQTMQASLSLFD